MTLTCEMLTCCSQAIKKTSLEWVLSWKNEKSFQSRVRLSAFRLLKRERTLKTDIQRLSQIVYWFSSVNVWFRCDTDSENGWTWLTNAYSNLTLSLWPLAFLKLSGHRAHKQLFKGHRCGSYGEFLKSYYFIISQLTELRSASATIFIGNSI